MSESEVGLQQQLDRFQEFCVKHGLTVNVKKTKVMVFNFVDPCQEFLFEGDAIECLQPFKYLRSYSKPPQTWKVQWNI